MKTYPDIKITALDESPIYAHFEMSYNEIFGNI